MANRLTTFPFEGVLASAALNAEFDNIYAGTVDRTAGRWGSNDNIKATFGSSQDAFFVFNTTQTSNALVLGVDPVSRSFLIVESGDETTNFAIANQTNPTVFIHSADQTVAADYVALTHNQTDGVVWSGAGDLLLKGSSGNGLRVNGDKVFINETEDAFITRGLSINIGAASNAALGFKQASVAHGITDVAETDTFGYFRERNTGSGGVSAAGFTGLITGYHIASYATSTDNTRSTAAIAGILLQASKKSGTTVATMGSDVNLLVVTDNGTARFILDSDGDSHQDVGTAWTNFDDHDDVKLLTSLSAHVTAFNDPLKSSFGQWLEGSREPLERLKIATFNDDGHHFVNWSRVHMLEIGAIRQLAARLDKLEGGFFGRILNGIKRIAHAH
jgi:hypothetical protein